ncbi:sugar phosphate nucleotidyltransferase [Myxococcota bacterium]
MTFNKAVIPMAGPAHWDLPLQQITTGEGRTEHVAALHIEELLAAGVGQVALVTRPGSRPLFLQLTERFGDSVVLIEQPEPRGFGHAVLCAERWVGGEPFLLQVCDHVFITYAAESCTRQLMAVALREGCCVSAVQATRESQLPYFGAIGGQRIGGQEPLYLVETLLEKPTPTVAEERCLVSGLRLGTYLAFFGVHALTPSVFVQLHAHQATLRKGEHLGLTESLAEVALREKYLALEVAGHRVDLEGPFGLLRAQLALALHGPRRDEVLALILEEVAKAQSHSKLRRGSGSR